MPPFIKKMVMFAGTDEEMSFGYFSVGDRVGPKAFNDNWDVMLVQSMLRFLSPNERGTPNHLCPVPTGNFDKLTARAIFNFQQRHRLEADWFIDPLHSHYQNISVNRNSRIIWTMAKLYFLVAEKALFEPIANSPAIEVLAILKKHVPQIGIVATVMRDEFIDTGIL